MARGWESKSVESQQMGDEQGGGTAGRRGTLVPEASLDQAARYLSLASRSAK